MKLQHLVAQLDELLLPDEISDYCPNGLQVQGREEVRRIISSVSSSARLFERAAVEQADLVLVHHGILWGSGPQPLVGSFGNRARLLLCHDISLVAYHLPLDGHLELGNAAQLALRLGLEELAPFGEHHGASVGVKGAFPSPMTLEALTASLAQHCEQQPLCFPGRGEKITTLGIVSGGGANEYYQAVAAGLDAYVTGEASEWTMHQAAEDGVHFFAAGHYATERFGILALGNWLRRTFDLEVSFVDLPNPV